MIPLRNPGEFMEWSTNDTCGAFTTHMKAWYGINQANLYTTLSDSHFATELPQCLSAAEREYKERCGADLFAFRRTPKLDWNKKPYESFVEKLFRLNCLENPDFPGPPKGGWCSLAKSFEVVDDIIRTTIIVAYADGPTFLAEKIGELAARLGLKFSLKDHAKDKGYYAQHFYMILPLSVSSPTAADEYPELQVPVEIQITTELQGALREITHRLYEQERLQGGLAPDWKTQFRSGRFRAAYMAHSLRFIEAMIVELREAVREPGGSV